jgi:hypothetical protein
MVRPDVHELTDPRWNGIKDVRVLVEKVDPVLQGWGDRLRRFLGQGLHRPGGTVRDPKSCVLHEKTIATPDEGRPHVGIERGSVVLGALRVAPGH